MGQGVLVTTEHTQINLPEHAAKEAAFKASKLVDNVKQRTWREGSGKSFTEAGKQDCAWIFSLPRCFPPRQCVMGLRSCIGTRSTSLIASYVECCHSRTLKVMTFKIKILKPDQLIPLSLPCQCCGAVSQTSVHSWSSISKMCSCAQVVTWAILITSAGNLLWGLSVGFSFVQTLAYFRETPVSWASPAHSPGTPTPPQPTLRPASWVLGPLSPGQLTGGGLSFLPKSLSPVQDPTHSYCSMAWPHWISPPLFSFFSLFLHLASSHLH